MNQTGPLIVPAERVAGTARRDQFALNGFSAKTFAVDDYFAA